MIRERASRKQVIYKHVSRHILYNICYASDKIVLVWSLFLIFITVTSDTMIDDDRQYLQYIRTYVWNVLQSNVVKFGLL